MESAIIVTYRCNSRCSMCNTWQNPTKQAEEFTPAVLESLPAGQTKINITGGEPTLRKDLLQIVAILRRKTSRLEISTNGSLPDRLFSVADRYPELTFRISLDGLPRTNAEVRGVPNGYELAMRSVEGLRERGVRDVGLAMTLSDRNVGDLIPLYEIAARQNLEFTQCVPHNSHYFHKHDNEIQDIAAWEEAIRAFIAVLLRSRRPSPKLRVKDWFRAYLNMGLLHHATHQTRPLACAAGRDFFFVDPFGDVLPCNGMAEKDPLGNLNQNPFEEIWTSDQGRAVRARVRSCERNCWMVGSAVPAMRRHPFRIARWVVQNKLRLLARMEPLIE